MPTALQEAGALLPKTWNYYRANQEDIDNLIIKNEHELF